MKFLRKKNLSDTIIFYLFPVLLLASCDRSNSVLKNEIFSISLNETRTAVTSIDYAGQNLLASDNAGQPLFNLRFRDRNEGGKIVEFDASKASFVNYSLKKNKLIIDYSDFEGVDLSARVVVNLEKSKRVSEWHIEVNNGTSYYLDHIDFPNLVVRNDLIHTGGSGRILNTAMEGCLIEDIRVRPNGVGLFGQYPNGNQMQFTAYYNDAGGLYLATHDDLSHPKIFDFHSISDNEIKLDLRLFTAGAAQGIYKLPYNVTVGVFDGDWYDATDIYRNWVENSDIPLPPKIADNDELPDWYFQSPVVVTYPVRGERDMDNMTPNKLFPYMNAIKYIERYAEEFGVPIMALLMHWEGSAPWAPPYVWPPYGGEKIYDDFVNALHEKGNLVGLYASGIGYTLRSNILPTYDMTEEYERKGLSSVMRVAPDGKIAKGKLTGVTSIRMGYDMCPANGFVKQVVADQIDKILKSNTDYIQYFDQNDGGGAFHCWGTEHGHSYGPGLWLTETMADIYDTCRTIIRRSGTKYLIGTEAAAAEPFMRYLPFNDGRASVTFMLGKPVPVYAYVYHEYVNNFMGNQVNVHQTIDIEQCPLNLLQRLTYSFCAGDLITIVIRDDGEMIWNWDGPWNVPGPDREQTVELIHNLCRWRQGIGKDYLIYGRMLKPLPVEGVHNVPMITRSGRKIPFESIIACNWLLTEGRKAQIIVNYLPEKQSVTVDVSGYKDIRVHLAPDHATGNDTKTGKIEVTIEPLSAIMISYQ